MSTWIALFRGINVGGHGRLPMKELVRDLEGLGLHDVETYVQSGNAVFSSAVKAPVLAAQIEDVVEKKHGFRPRVLVLSDQDFRAAAAANPFPAAEEEPKTVHLFFLATACTDPDLAALDRLKLHAEQYLLTGSVFYLHTPKGYASSKLAARVERSLGVPATARNWRTVTKLLELAGIHADGTR
ncbi:MAG: DUF1697 domain-containing protein [Acidobacteriota bacterium]|nr:DUF1697 domain-containing protein [Acidobacteriota bacterium]